MAETRKPKTAKTAKTAKPRKAKAAQVSKGAAAKPVKKAPAKAKRAAARRPASTRTSTSGFDGIAKLIDHPLVADLLAVGAMAAVAAIADHSVKTRTGEAEAGSSKAVKAAGMAAAAAIGKRLMTEVKEVRKASKPAGR